MVKQLSEMEECSRVCGGNFITKKQEIFKSHGVKENMI